MVDTLRPHEIDAMATAICNVVRDEHGLEPLRNLDNVENPSHYRKLAAAAFYALRKERDGK